MTRFDAGCHGPELSAYLDGELDAPRAAEIEALLSESPEARAYLEELRTVASGLRGLPRLSAPDALRAALRHQPAMSGGGNAPVKRGNWIIALRTGAMAAVLGILWVAGQSVMGPVQAPQTPATTPEDALLAKREPLQGQNKPIEDEPTLALGPGLEMDRSAFKDPGVVPPPAAPAGGDASNVAATTGLPGRGFDGGGYFSAGRDGGGRDDSPAIAADEELPSGDVNVVINTRTPAEFSAVNGLLLSFQNAPDEGKTAYVARLAESDGGELHQLEIARSELGALVEQLEVRAPQNVAVKDLAAAETAAPAAAQGDAVARPAAEARKPAARTPSGSAAPAPGGVAGGLREPAKKEAARQEQPGRTVASDGRRRSGEAAPKEPAEAPPQAPPPTGARQQQENLGNRDAGRGGGRGRVVYRSPNQRSLAQQRSGNALRVATQPDAASDTVVVNVLVAPPVPTQQSNEPVQSEAQSQPASRRVP